MTKRRPAAWFITRGRIGPDEVFVEDGSDIGPGKTLILYPAAWQPRAATAFVRMRLTLVRQRTVGVLLMEK